MSHADFFHWCAQHNCTGSVVLQKVEIHHAKHTSEEWVYTIRLSVAGGVLAVPSVTITSTSAQEGMEQAVSAMARLV